MGAQSLVKRPLWIHLQGKPRVPWEHRKESASPLRESGADIVLFSEEVWKLGLFFFFLAASGLNCRTQDLHCIRTFTVLQGLPSCGAQSRWDLSSSTTDWTLVPCIARTILFICLFLFSLYFARQILNHWSTSGVHVRALCSIEERGH